MDLALRIPDEVAERLAASGAELWRRTLEAFALEAAQGRANHRGVGVGTEVAGVATRDELDGFLKAHDVWLGYSVDDLECERAALRRLRILRVGNWKCEVGNWEEPGEGQNSKADPSLRSGSHKPWWWPASQAARWNLMVAVWPREWRTRSNRSVEMRVENRKLTRMRRRSTV